MCTASCPCPLSTASNGNWHSLYTTDRSIDRYAIANFNRTVNSTPSTNITLTPFTLSAAPTITYDNFWDCYLNLMAIDEQISNVDPNY